MAQLRNELVEDAGHEAEEEEKVNATHDNQEMADDQESDQEE